jgi:antitoxin PrlF
MSEKKRKSQMITSKIGRRGQVTLPRQLRRLLDLQEGDRIAFVQRGEELVLHPIKKTLLDLRGSVPVSGPQDFDAIRQQVIHTHADQIAKETG